MSKDKPKPDFKQYEKLIQEIEDDGTIKIPKFQREFVWRVDGTAKLLDSILKGYPIGTFILWQTDRRMREVKEIGGQDLPEANQGEKIQYVLDGQQRITSLYAAYKGLEIKKYGEAKATDYKNIYVNLEYGLDSGEQIVTHIKPDGEHVTLHQVLNYKPSSSKDIRPEHADKVFDYYNIFTSYNFSTIVLMKDDVASAIEVFTRINTGGKTLTLFEIMCAVTYDEARGFDMQSRWENFIDKLIDKQIKYENIPSSIILNLLSLLLSKGKECKRSIILNLDKKDIIDNWDSAISSLEYSIDYFRKFFGIPVSQLLPYDSLLIPFAYFFFNNEQSPSQEQRKYLEEFFWRASVSYRYSASTETALTQDIRRIDKIIKNERPEYDDMKVFISEKMLMDKEFRAGESFCKAILCLLAGQVPKELDDNTPVLLDGSWLKAAHSRNYHHFFPKSFLSSDGKENANSLMNITFISDQANKRKIGVKSPSVYIAEFSNENEEIEQSLQSHFIELSGFGIENDDYEEFLKARAKAIFEKIKSKIIFSEQELSEAASIDFADSDTEETLNFESPILNSELLELIEGGETDKVEFKAALSYDTRTEKRNRALEYATIKNIAAFMNTDGGHHIIGVKDDGSIVGIDRDISILSDKSNDAFRRHLTQLFINYIGVEFTSCIKIQFLTIDDKVVCVVAVKTPIESVFVEDYEGKIHYYAKADATCRSLSPKEQSKHERERWSR